MQHSIEAEPSSAALLQPLQRMQAEACRHGLPRLLIALACLRVAQLSGCARLTAALTAAALSTGETPGRLGALSEWVRSPLFSAQERAALQWSEAVTGALKTRVPEEAWKRLVPQFTPSELVDLALAAVQQGVHERLSASLTPPQLDDLTVLVTLLNTHIYRSLAGHPAASRHSHEPL